VIERHVLITNVNHALVDAVKTYCNAVLLSRTADPYDRRRSRCEMIGFGTEAAWRVFSLPLATIDHELRDDQIMLDPAAQSGPRILLLREDIYRPLAVRIFEWEPDDDRERRRDEIWTALERSVADHWQPRYMPRLTHVAPGSYAAPRSPK